MKRYIRSTLSQSHLFNSETSSSSSASRDSAWSSDSETLLQSMSIIYKHDHFTCKLVFNLEGILLCSVCKPKLVQQFSDDFSTGSGRSAFNSPV